MAQTHNSVARSQRLLLLRHGATGPNLAGLRCGGDLDVELSDTGRAQAEAAALRLAALAERPGLIVAAALRRTRATAEIVAAALGGVEIRVEPGFVERRLGAWNLLPIIDTEARLRAGETPPGGEAEGEFVRRIGAALNALRPLMPRKPLLVASKGVGRAIGVAVGRPTAVPLGNGEIAEFELAISLFTRCSSFNT